MNSVHQLTNVNEVIGMWRRLRELATGVLPEDLLQTYLTCLSRGAVFVVKGDRGLIGSCCVETMASIAVLRSIPRDSGEALGKLCLSHVQQWAKLNNLTSIQVAAEKMNGSTFRYFEKSLGFRRQAVIFNLKVK